MDIKKLKSYTNIKYIFMISLLLVTIGFNLVPFSAGNNDIAILNQINLQVARDEFIAKDVMILAYRSPTFHSQAISELQTTFPSFQQVQNGLLHGDATLGLPSMPDDVQHVMLQSQDDYAAISTALKIILASPDSIPDTIQVNIIMRHEMPYALAVYQASLFYTQHAEARRDILLALSSTFSLIAIIVITLYYFLIFRKYTADQEKAATQPLPVE